MSRSLIACVALAALGVCLGCRHVCGVNDCVGDPPLCAHCRCAGGGASCGMTGTITPVQANAGESSKGSGTAIESTPTLPQP